MLWSRNDARVPHLTVKRTAHVRELIRADQRRRAKDKLEAMLVEGLSSGASIPADAKFWKDLKQEAMTKLAALKALRPRIS